MRGEGNIELWHPNENQFEELRGAAKIYLRANASNFAGPLLQRACSIGWTSSGSVNER